jgi:pimeloyl-ACP methyl ester carboxylesterase
MRFVKILGLAGLMVASLLSWCRAEASDPILQEHGPARALAQDQRVADLSRFEPSGLSILQPYAKDKIPVVFIHGLWSGPWSWSRMIRELEADPSIAERYQFWTFGYSTGDPLPYSAWLLRQAIGQSRAKFNRDSSDPAFDRMVLVGQSMGGLLAKMMAQESKSRLWSLLSNRPFEQLTGEPEDVKLLREAIFFEPRPEIRRVIFIATPHRGSQIDDGPVKGLGAQLVRVADPLRAAYDRLKNRNGPDFFIAPFRFGLPTSIDELKWQSPFLLTLCDPGLLPKVPFHSIIADRRDPPRPGGFDGIVPYASAHLDGAASELLITGWHLCQDHPQVISEVRRILAEHGKPPERLPLAPAR